MGRLSTVLKRFRQSATKGSPCIRYKDRSQIFEIKGRKFVFKENQRITGIVGRDLKITKQKMDRASGDILKLRIERTTYTKLRISFVFKKKNRFVRISHACVDVYLPRPPSGGVTAHLYSRFPNGTCVLYAQYNATNAPLYGREFYD